MKNRFFKLTCILLLLMLNISISAKSPDQTLIEMSLVENKYFLYVLNTSLSNFGTKEEVNSLKKANKHDFLSRLWFLQGAYRKAYNEIRKSQEILKEEYKSTLEKYLDDTRIFLETPAARIIRSKDVLAQHYLKLGFRDLKSSMDFLEIGFNYNRLLFSNKIKIYIEGIKRARRAKRYAILAMIESVTPMAEKADYQLQTLDEHLNPLKKIKVSSYERVKTKLINLFGRKLLEPKIEIKKKVEVNGQEKEIDYTINVLLHNDDNYTKISTSIYPIKSSILAAVKDEELEFDPLNPPESKALILDRDLIIEKIKKQKEDKIKKQSSVDNKNSNKQSN